MSYDKNISPVGWYVASYLLRFIELDDVEKDNPEKRFLSWENTVLVQAKSLDEAFAKVTKLARAATKPYRGGDKSVPVKWTFEGITSLFRSTSNSKTVPRLLGQSIPRGSSRRFELGYDPSATSTSNACKPS